MVLLETLSRFSPELPTGLLPTRSQVENLIYVLGDSITMFQNIFSAVVFSRVEIGKSATGCSLFL